MNDASIVGEILGILVAGFGWVAILARSSLEALTSSENSIEMMTRYGMVAIAYLAIATIMTGSLFYLFAST